MNRYVLLALALISGLLQALAFPSGDPVPFGTPLGLPAAGWICLFPLLVSACLARRSRDALLYGLVAGVLGYGLILSWIFRFLTQWGHLTGIAALPLFLLLVCYLALYTGVWCWFVHLMNRRWNRAVALFLSPFCWAGLELIRAELFTGFPWGLLGSSQYSWPVAIQVADLGGVYAVSFVLACFSSVVAGLVLRVIRGPGPAFGVVSLVLTGLIAGSLLYGVKRIDSPEPGVESVRIALVQANVTQQDKWTSEFRVRIEEDHFMMTREAASMGAEVVIWSESAVPRSVSADTLFATRLERLARETGVEVLTGSVAYEGEGRSIPLNSAFLVDPALGVTGRSDKSILVPFGEYVPLRNLLFFLEPLVEEAGSFEPARRISVLSTRHGYMGVLICYEVIFPEVARALVRSGASILVNITNDAWYDRTGMPAQHLAQSVLRSVETRRWLVRCANTGISAVIDPSGRIQQKTGSEEAALLVADVGALQTMTAYAAVGDSFAIFCVILTILAIAHARAGRAGAPEPTHENLAGGQ